MAKVETSDLNAPFFNPASYGNLNAELKKLKSGASGKTRVRGAKKAEFQLLLEHAEETGGLSGPASEDALRELLDDVHSTGDDLKSRPFLEEIRRYKQAVRNFLAFIVQNGYDVLESSGGSPLKPKKYTTVQVVDRKLEQLAVGILSGQAAQLDILARIDEIAGLLVDLLQ